MQLYFYLLERENRNKKRERYRKDAKLSVSSMLLGLIYGHGPNLKGLETEEPNNGPC